MHMTAPSTTRRTYCVLPEHLAGEHHEMLRRHLQTEGIPVAIGLDVPSRRRGPILEDRLPSGLEQHEDEVDFITIPFDDDYAREQLLARARQGDDEAGNAIKLRFYEDAYRASYRIVLDQESARGIAETVLTEIVSERHASAGDFERALRSRVRKTSFASLRDEPSN